MVHWECNDDILANTCGSNAMTTETRRIDTARTPRRLATPIRVREEERGFCFTTEKNKLFLNCNEGIRNEWNGNYKTFLGSIYLQNGDQEEDRRTQ